MCNKTNVTKRFFLLLHHPHHFQKPTILHIFPNQMFVQQIVKESKEQTFLTKKQSEILNISPSVGARSYFLPIEIPRDWFLH